MGFLRRILGGGDPGPGPASGPAPDPAPGAADEQARDRELLLAEGRRLDDELIQRQLRYADRSWTPQPQGGSRRADDGEAEAGRER
jgi:hypothetical protein